MFFEYTPVSRLDGIGNARAITVKTLNPDPN